MTCLIVEDEPLARHLITQYVEKILSLNLVKACSNPLEAIEILRSTHIDILFLDVQMPEITGTTLLKLLQKKPYIILTTAYSEYALEGYELEVSDYLLKPITFERFLKAVERATQRLTIGQNNGGEVHTEEPLLTDKTNNSESIQPFIFVKDGTKLVKIKLSDIMYIEGLKDYITIYTPNKKIVSLQRIKVLEAQLPDNQFIRIHNSYIVALAWIDSIHKERVEIGKNLLPISDTYRKAFKDFIDRNNIKLD
ncbi:MAG: LytTR family DNA-binding domain-containing protein [Saprospiraceae bacterium]|nr:LytTR family DNA-binding domain-containing protein [Saprospiraceae bacterium]